METPFKATGTVNGYDYVDLGLSVKWATFNVGATKPEEYGGYYAWGETEQKRYYDLSTYKWYDGLYKTLTKYKNKSRDLVMENIQTILDPEDDVAHVKWGGSWRMPTLEEQDELRANCIWKWYDSGNTEFNGVAGYKVISKVEGYKDRFIFLPAAGHRYETNIQNIDGGYYWSSSNNQWYLYFDSYGHYTHYIGRTFGQSVRPVCP